MADIYTLDGIPSDVLIGAYGDRRLKVDASVTAAPDSPLDALYTKDFTYDVDGNLDIILITETATGNKTQKKFNYNPDGSFLNITTTVVV